MPRHADHDQRRREIAYAVWYVTAQAGLEAVTVRAVAAEAGISVGRIQHYFASKEEMIRGACRELVAAADERHREQTESADPLTALRTLVQHAIPTTPESRIATAVWFAYVTKSVADPEIAEILRSAKQGEEREAARMISAAQQAGQLASHLDPSVEARRLLATADGLALRVFLGTVAAEAATQHLDETLGMLTVLHQSG